MPYFDLHCHPGLKTLFQVQNGKQLSVWEDLSTGAMGKVLGSQSSFRQIIKDGKTNLVCLTLHPPEKGMTNQFVIFLAALTLAKNAIDYDRLVEISSTNCLYQTIFYQELANVMKTKGALKKVKFIKDWVEYNRADFDTLHILFNIEGGHTFYDMGNKIGNFDQVLQNFKKFLDLKYRILYFTPTHLTPNEFITHAYGNKILSKGQLLPKGIGITPYGIQLIEYALSQKILIDVKHMSLVSRRIYYHWRKLKGETSPIIASHIGLAGNSWTSAFEPAPTHKFKSYGYKVHWQQNLEPKTGKSFYPLSINLYNEDIEEIVKSGGLIGISLDVRILGGSKTGLQKDFYSHEEFDLLASGHLAAEAAIESHAAALANGGMANGNFMLNMQNLEGEETEEIEDSVSEIRAVLNTTQPIKKLAHYQDHLNLVTSHIIRIFEICDWTNAGNPVKNICIGSDFDGLIEPLDCCQNASEFEAFATALKSALKTRLTGLNIKNLPASEAESLVDRIMYGNAIEFMDRIWNKNQSPDL